MSNEQELLSEEEISALSEGVNSGEIDTSNSQNAQAGEALHYDFHKPAHILKARLPALDMINERFGKHYQSSLFGVLNRLIQIEVDEVELIKYADYVNSVPLNTNINRVRVNELNGAILFAVNADLVYVIIDCFFGGPGVVGKQTDKQEYTATEKRVIERVLSLAFTDLHNAWSPVMALTFDYLHAESRNQMTNLADATEVVVVSKFKLILNGSKGEFQIVIPYSLLEPLRPLLASGARKEQIESDASWRNRLKERVGHADVEIGAVFAEAELFLGELFSLKTGDFIPISVNETTVVCAGDTPLFEGKIGVSNNAVAVRLKSWDD